MNSIKLRKSLKRINAILTAVAVAGSALFVVAASNPSQASALTFGGVRDCDANAVVYCGAKSVGELQNKYNQSVSTQHIYSYFGITRTDVNDLNDAVAGYVTKSGDVLVNGKVVATGAVTAGREYISGSRKVTSQGTTFYVRPPSVSFLNNKLTAFVVMRNGVFQYAILTSCGNPVTAKPVLPPKPPTKPTPKPSSLECVSLKASKLSDNEYEFTAKASAQNATITGYTFNFGDQTSANTKSNQATHKYAKAGSHKATVTVSGIVNGKKVSTPQSSACAATVTIPKKVSYCKPGIPVGSPECQPATTPMCEVPGKTNLPANSPECVTPPVTTTTPPSPTPPAPTTLVNTGPGEVLGIFAASSTVAAIGSRLYLRRRYQA